MWPRPRCPAGRGRAHLQDVGEAVLELVPAQRLAVHAHLPEQGPLAPQPPGHSVQQRGFPGACGRAEKALEGVPPRGIQAPPRAGGPVRVQPDLLSREPPQANSRGTQEPSLPVA